MQAQTARRSGQMASESEQTAMTIALRVPIFANCWGPVAAGRWKAAMSSSSRAAWRLGPVTNSATGMRRVPVALASSTSASET